MKTKATDIELAMQGMSVFDKAFRAILEDLVRSKIDMRTIKKETRDLIMVARQKRDELIRRRELREVSQIVQKPTEEKH